MDVRKLHNAWEEKWALEKTYRESYRSHPIYAFYVLWLENGQNMYCSQLNMYIPILGNNKCLDNEFLIWMQSIIEICI